MISIDTSIMRDLAAAASNANNAINDAMDLLQRISAHNDWACKEKDAINEYSNTNKNRIRRLQECSAAFLNAISGASSEFEETENSISDMFSSVESIISNILSITSGVGIIGSNTANTPHFFHKPFKEIVKHILIDVLPTSRMDGFDPFDSFTSNNIINPISVCSFADIDLG